MPFEFLAAADYVQWRKAQSLRPYLTNGRRTGWRTLRFTRHDERANTWPMRIGLLPEKRVNAAAPAFELLQSLREYRPHVVQGYASALRALALEARGSSEPLPRIELVFSDSEVLTPRTRALVESVLGAPVLDVYGSFEADNMAYECRRRTGMHVALDSVVAEIVDERGQVLPDGAAGELVVTILRNELMPFIRYRTGDLARLLPQACPCGRSFPLLELVGGRRYDLLRLADGTAVPALGLVGGFEDASEVLEFRILQTSVDAFTVQVVPSGSTAIDAVKAAARRRIRDHAPTADVKIEILDRIPRTPAGKLLPFSCLIGTS